MDKDMIRQRLARFEVALIADGLDACGRIGQVLSASLAPIGGRPSRTVVGRVRTLAFQALPPDACFPPVDKAKKLGFLRRLEGSFEPGDALVTGMVGEIAECGVVGGLFATLYKNLGLSAVVIDGFIRDRAVLAELGIPIFARGSSPRNGAGRVKVQSFREPITVSGVRVADGDYLAVDADGLVVVPAEEQLLGTLFAWLDETAPNEQATADLVSSGTLLSDAFEKYSRI